MGFSPDTGPALSFGPSRLEGWSRRQIGRRLSRLIGPRICQAGSDLPRKQADEAANAYKKAAVIDAKALEPKQKLAELYLNQRKPDAAATTIDHNFASTSDDDVFTV